MSDSTDQRQEAPSSWLDKTLKIAGIGYSIGDITLAISGKLSGKNDVVRGALIWLAGGVAAAQFGNPSPQKQLELVAGKFEQYMKAQGVTIPEDVRQQNILLKRRSFLQKCSDFLYQHPSEMLNLMYGIGALFLLRDGIRDVRTEKKSWYPKFTQEHSLDGILNAVNSMSKELWMGGVIGTGAATGLLIKEDPNAQIKARNGGFFEKAAAYIKQKPLRLTGALYGANNIFTVLRFIEEKRNKGQYATLKPHWFSGATAAAYIISNALLTTVSRDQIKTDSMSMDAFANLEEAAARVIVAQPLEAQKLLLQEVAELLAKQKNIQFTASEIAHELTNHVAYLTKERAQSNVQKWSERVNVMNSMQGNFRNF